MISWPRSTHQLLDSLGDELLDQLLELGRTKLASSYVLWREQGTITATGYGPLQKVLLPLQKVLLALQVPYSTTNEVPVVGNTPHQTMISWPPPTRRFLDELLDKLLFELAGVPPSTLEGIPPGFLASRIFQAAQAARHYYEKHGHNLSLLAFLDLNPDSQPP